MVGKRPSSGDGGGFNAALARDRCPAGVGMPGAPHALRHTWASWHYALHRDPLRLRAEGGWSSLALVERYAHLMPAGHEAAIGEFWGTRGRERGHE